ncbi:MAG: enolase C-terminal domain-like protein [Myxococcota bacterium]
MSVVRVAAARIQESSWLPDGERVRGGLRLGVTGDDGRVGLGEAAPLPGRSPELLSAARAALEAWALTMRAEIDLANPLPQIEELAAPMRRDRLPSAAFAVETALLDLVAQARGESVAALLRGAPPHRELEVNATVDLVRGRGSIELVAALVRRGFRTFKVKSGDASFDVQCRALEHVRRRFGAGLRLRLDAAGSWPLAEATARLDRLAPLALEYVEQPVAAAELAGLARGVVPMAADETMETDGGPQAVFDAGNCSAVVLKPALLGGLCHVRKLACTAQKLGLAVVITHAFDGPLGLAVACELSLSLPFAPAACGLTRHQGLAVWPSLMLPQLDGPRLRPSGGTGLGLSAREREQAMWLGEA